MTQIYEGMFLLDNNVVRQNWREAKGIVQTMLEKHGGTIQTLRRWDERRLAYPVKRNNRATYFLAYYEMPGDEIPNLRRDLDLSETVLRYLFTAVDAVPDDERAKAAEEEDKDYIVPEPPADDAADPEPEAEETEKPAEAAKAEGDKPAEGDQPAEGDKPADAPAEGEAPAAETAEAPAPAATPAAEPETTKES